MSADNNMIAEVSHTPGPLTVEPTSQSDQFAVRSDYSVEGEWRDIYVNFSGYFGSYGPHVFAAAPELLTVAQMYLAWGTLSLDEFWERYPDLPRGEGVGFVNKLARAAIRKATGEQSS